MIHLYAWKTPNGCKAAIMLEETGLPYRVHPVERAIPRGRPKRMGESETPPSWATEIVGRHETCWRTAADMALDAAPSRRAERKLADDRSRDGLDLRYQPLGAVLIASARSRRAMTSAETLDARGHRFRRRGRRPA